MEVLAFFVLWFAFAGFTAYVAKEKNRNVAGWFVGGFLFGILALIVLACLGKLPAED